MTCNQENIFLALEMIRNDFCGIANYTSGRDSRYNSFLMR